MMLSVRFILFLSLLAGSLGAAELKTRNVILITTDGLRWQEVFTGAEEMLLSKDTGGVKDVEEIKAAYWRATPEARREALMPFLWHVIAKQGQLLGNTNKGSVVRVTNGLNFSYPGYNEILAGYPDPRIQSNAKRENPNTSMLAWLNKKPGFQGKVAAFACWDVFPYILKADTCGFPVIAEPDAFEKLATDARGKMLADLVRETTPAFKGVLYDSMVFHGALDYLKEKKPRMLYISFGETDDWAHEGRYDMVLESAHHVDDFIHLIWETVQSMPEYKDQTTLILSTDHGRGSGKSEWRSHGASIQGAQFIWIAAMGPDTEALGERENANGFGQNQIAATIAALLAEDYCAEVSKAGRPIKDFLPK